MTDLAELIEEAVAEAPDKMAAVAQLRDTIARLSPRKEQPIDRVLWVPLSKVTPNDYNPNSVAKIEMGLLYTSIAHDGYTQPVVTIWDAERQLFVIVDGFHRYYTMKTNKDIYDRCGGLLPIVVIDKPLNDRMASTVRHNRARGKHSVQGMSSMVFQMLENGWGDAEICNELGMQPEELLRLKHVTGFSKLFADVEYQRAWTNKRQILAAKKSQILDPGPGSPRPGKAAPECGDDDPV